MKNKTQLGMNRTAIALSPRMGPRMSQTAERFPPSSVGDGYRIQEARALYVAHASPFGTMPPPASLKEAGVNALNLLKGNKASVFMDKLSNRLAFERTGARLYEMLMARVKGGPSWEGGPTGDDVSLIYNEELRHFRLVKECIEQLGGDPTLVSPSADVTAVASLGILQVLGDPRIPLRYALDAILTVELVDNEAWSHLVELATTLGQTEMAEEFQRANAVEEEHLQRVRHWVKSALIAEANRELEEEPGEDQQRLEQISLPD